MPEVDHEAYFRDYLTLLNALTSQGQSRDERESAAREAAGRGPFGEAQAAGWTLDATAYLALLGRREAARQAWRSFFQAWDVLVCPTALDAAFPHQTGDQHAHAVDR